MPLRINEIFHSIQGESTHAGRPCVFVRLTYCHLRCRWCDTEYAFFEGSERTLDEIVAEVGRYGCRLVEVTGGEPLIQKETTALLRRLLDAGHEVLLETSGSWPIDDVPDGVRIIMDLKAPGSGMAGRNRWENLGKLDADDEVKIVIADRADYEWARDVIARAGHTLHVGGPFWNAGGWDLLSPVLLPALSERGVVAHFYFHPHDEAHRAMVRTMLDQAREHGVVHETVHRRVGARQADLVAARRHRLRCERFHCLSRRGRHRARQRGLPPARRTSGA